MTRQTTTPLTFVPTTVSLWSIEEYTSRIRDGRMILDAPYQRGSVWTPDQRLALMKSWLTGVPVAAAVLNTRTGPSWRATEASGVHYAVIDGRQRIETAIAWQDDELAIPASWLPGDWIRAAEDTDDGPYVRVSGLHHGGETILQRMELPCVRAHLGWVVHEAAIYRLLNRAGTAHSEQDMSRAEHIAEV
ncbi:DUF262 domain-containing protein [Actinoplanes subtropicus]|uniref:DUF262 domain-containing protein n=1 Tax=Actinoplanes subtropicus TaxID=543632 RepID=UPI0004C34EEB|nr:DUF262 domain-containing protein [Actinoplanes subtropicus]